jgi:hypothetical protein
VAQAKIDPAESNRANQVVGEWIRRALRAPTASEYFRTTLDAAFQARLDRFFEEELTDAQRDWLLSLPGDEMLRELRRMYFSAARYPNGPGRGPRGPGPGPSGPRGPERDRTPAPEPPRPSP